MSQCPAWIIFVDLNQRIQQKRAELIAYQKLLKDAHDQIGELQPRKQNIKARKSSWNLGGEVGGQTRTRRVGSQTRNTE
jgi:hypothetical protein